MQAISYKHHLSGQPDDAFVVITQQSRLLKTERNMQLLCTRWTWLTSKHEIKGFFIFFNMKKNPFLAVFFYCVNNPARFMIVKKQTMYFRRWLLIIWSTDPSEIGASLDQAKHKEHGIAAPLALEIFFLYS